MYEGGPTLITASLILIPKIRVYTVLVQVGLVRNVLLFFVGDLHHLLSSGGFESNKNQAFIVLQWNRIFGVYSFRV